MRENITAAGINSRAESGRCSMGAVNRFWVLCVCMAAASLPAQAGCTVTGQHPPATDLSAQAGTPAAHARTCPRTQASTKEPFFNARSQLAEYAGPGRETPPPDDIAEVKVGYFGPNDPDHPAAGQMWLAATMAVGEANDANGYNSLPFRLVTSWSENPWGTGIKGVTRMAYDDDVWAITGAPDGPSAHLVEQIVAKARLTFISPVSTDKTTNLANVAWIFSCAPGDHLLAPPLAEALASRTTGRSFAVVSCTDHDSRMFLMELLAALKKLKAFPALHVQFRPGSLGPKHHDSGSKPDNSGFDSQLHSIREARPAAVALIAGPQDAAQFLISMRQAGLSLPVFGGPAMGHTRFVKTAGPSAEGVLFPLLWHTSAAGERSATFARRFQEQFGIRPDYTAAHTYDAVTLLIAAIHKAGLNRARIRDAVRQLSPWTGVTGTITWDHTGHNHRPVRLGTIRNGQVTPVG